jgi:hypothetical protein
MSELSHLPSTRRGRRGPRQQKQLDGNSILRYPSRFYALLVNLYPHSFRQEFADEMQAVFAQKLQVNLETGLWAAWLVLWKELRDWPGAILAEYWSAIGQILGRGLMSLVFEDKSWKIEKRRDAMIASLPPVLFGVGIALGALVIWEPWYVVPQWRLWMGVGIGLVPAAVVAVGGFLALVKRLPVWGYSWAGGAVMGAVVLVKTLAEEQADFGLPLLSPVLDILLAIFLLLGIAALVLATAWRGWRQAGLTSLGFATLAGMSSFGMATAAPLNRYDLALLAAPVGALMSMLTYLYVRKGDAGRLLAILGYGVLNATVFLTIADAWDLPIGGPSPVIPFLVVLTGALLVGPVAGIIGRPVRGVIRGS